MELVVYLKVLVLAILIAIPIFVERGFKLYHPAILVSLVCFLEFGIPTLYMTFNPGAFWVHGGFSYETLPTSLSKGLDFVILCFVFFLIGFYIPKFDKHLSKIITTITNRIPNIAEYTVKIGNLSFLITVLLVIGWISRLIIIKLGVYNHVESGWIAGELVGFQYYAQYLHIGSLFPLVANSIVFFEWIKDKNKTEYFVFTVILLLIEIAYALPSGSKERVFMPLFLLIILYSLKSRLPVIPAIVAAFFFFFFIFPYTQIYRLIYSGNMLSDMQFAYGKYLTLISRFDVELINGIFFTIFGERLNYANIVSRIVVSTPTIWDFKLGYSYLLFFISIVPRILWPGKPEITGFGNEFGRAYGFNHPQDFVSSVDMSWIGEMFINFGWFGVIVSFLYGLFYRVIYNYFTEGKRFTFLSAVLYAFTLYYMIRGGVFSSFGGLLKIYFVVIILFLPFMKKIKDRSLSQQKSQ